MGNDLGSCPNDTDGDGNCGSRHCPYCGSTEVAEQHRQALLKRRRVDRMRQALANHPTNAETYQKSAAYHAVVDTLAPLLVDLLDPVVEVCDEARKAEKEAVERMERESPRYWVSLPPGDTGSTLKVEEIKDQLVGLYPEQSRFLHPFLQQSVQITQYPLRDGEEFGERAVVIRCQDGHVGLWPEDAIPFPVHCLSPTSCKKEAWVASRVVKIVSSDGEPDGD